MENITLKDVLSKKGYIRGPFGSALKRGEMKEEGIPVYEQQNAIYNNRNFRYFIDKEKYDTLKRFTVQENDLLISCSGTVGRVSIIKKDEPKGIISQALLILRPNTNIILPEFLYYFFTSKKGYNSIVSRSTGSVQVNIAKRNIIESIGIKIPKLEIQKKIISILKSLDDKIEVNNQMNQTLEEMAQTIFKEWFVEFNFPNEDGVPYKDNGGEMEESELGMIPKGWRVGLLGEILEKIVDNRGKTPPLTEDGIRLLEGYQLFCEKAFPDFEAGKKQKFVNRETYEKWFRAGHPEYLDVLCATVGTLPKWCFAPKNREICIAQNVIALRTKKNIISPYYLRSYMNTREFIGEVDGRTVTTAQPSIKVGYLTSINIIIPNKKVINKFDEIVSKVYEKLLEIDLENQTLIKTRDTLLPKLMSGEVRV